MESDLGKLFIGGISWDTDEDRLKEYFGNYGEVVEAVIMRDRTTGRARGFGFIVFSDPSVAERVIMDKHIIDGRTVEAKKAVPKDDQHIPIRNVAGSIQGSPGPTRTRKIFVGGLASTVTETDFKSYFDQFGTITDVVVMYDHNTQRPRGFGFITFDSEEAVDRVLLRTFHELNGKMVEVKRAVPKELSPAGPTRGAGGSSPLIGYAYGAGNNNAAALSIRGSSLLSNNYANQGYNFGPISGLGLRFDERFGQMPASRGGFSPFGSSGYGLGLNLDQQGLSPTYSSNPIGNNGLGYARMLSPYYNSNGGNSNNNNGSNRYNTPIGYNVSNGRTTSSGLSSAARNAWGGAGAGGSHNALNPGSPGGYLSSGSGSFGVWGVNNIISAQGGSGGTGYSDSSSFGFGEGGYGRSGGAQTSASTVGYERSYGGDVYRGGGGGSVYVGDSTWRPEIDGSNSFGYGLGNIGSDVGAKSSEDFIGSYSVTTRQPNRGIAA